MTSATGFSAVLGTHLGVDVGGHALQLGRRLESATPEAPTLARRLRTSMSQEQAAQSGTLSPVIRQLSRGPGSAGGGHGCTVEREETLPVPRS